MCFYSMITAFMDQAFITGSKMFFTPKHQAVENDIQPNLLRNWKKESLTNASLAFDNKREDNLRENLPKNARKKPNTPKRLANLLRRLTGSKKI